MAKKIKKQTVKFQFGTDFQEQILQFVVTDPKGYIAINLVSDDYFTYIPHAVICHAIKKYFNKRKKIPALPYLRETLRTLFESGYKALSNITDQDRADVEMVLNRLYETRVSDEEEIMAKIVNFAKYAKFKEEVESIDINNYEAYASKIESFNKVNNIGKELTQDYGVFLIGGMTDRAYRRSLEQDITPTPFWQLNNTMNSGGTARGNVICVIAEEKRFKTGFLINVAKGYLKRKMKGVIFDLENGQSALTVRNEQSYAGLTRQEILSEQYDKKLMKLFRRYKRLGAELVIKRFPALSTTTDDLQAFLDMLKEEKGFVADFAILDYGFLLKALSGKTDDFNRISDSFVDLKNFSEKNKFIATWTVAHVVREAVKRRGTIYKPGDIAKCIDIPRHVDMLLGLQESEDETQAGVMRLEVIEQRDGLAHGKTLFWVDLAKQTIREFTKSEVAEYKAQFSDGTDGEPESKEQKKKKRKTDI